MEFESLNLGGTKTVINDTNDNIIVNAKVVVNADDFGYSSSLNQAILKSFDLNLHSTTTLMCNMPGFDEACDLAFENKITDRIGIHLNMTEGKPLTKGLKKFRNFVNEDGEMFKSFKGHFFSRDEKNAIYEELQAQLDRFKSKRFLPTHVDTHHHFHFFMSTFPIIKELAVKNMIPAVRLRFNWGKLSIQRRFYSKIVNTSIALAGLAKTSRFCEIRTVDKKLLSLNKPIEVMVHPAFGENNEIVNYLNGENLEELVNNHLPRRNFVTYDFLNKQN